MGVPIYDLDVTNFSDPEKVAGASLALTLLDAVPMHVSGTVVDAGAAWLAPGSAAGQLLAAAYDRAMTPAEWADWSSPAADPVFRYAVLVAWRSEVLEPFARRFGLVLEGGENLGPLPPTLALATANRDGGALAWQMYLDGELLPARPLHRVADAIVRRPPGAGLFYVWGSDRGVATNDAIDGR